VGSIEQHLGLDERRLLGLDIGDGGIEGDRVYRLGLWRLRRDDHGGRRIDQWRLGLGRLGL
jgi:hypothetical protein